MSLCYDWKTQNISGSNCFVNLDYKKGLCLTQSWELFCELASVVEIVDLEETALSIITPRWLTVGTNVYLRIIFVPAPYQINTTCW